VRAFSRRLAGIVTVIAVSGAPAVVSVCLSMCVTGMAMAPVAADAAHAHHEGGDAVMAGADRALVTSTVSEACDSCCPGASSTSQIATTTPRSETHGLASAPLESPVSSAVTMARPSRVAPVRAAVFPPAPTHASLVLRI
jgi:hypothetical protein